MFDFLKRRFKTKDDWNSKVRQNCANSGEMKIYNYFDNDCIKVYDAATIEELSPKILSCVCAFQYTTLGAMGLGGIILMFNENGDSYSVSYFGEEIKQDANGNNIHNVYETYAYEYINKYLDLEDKTAVSRGEWRMEKDGWTTITNGLGWYIVCRNDVLNKMPEMNVFEDVEDVMFHFPDYFGE